MDMDSCDFKFLDAFVYRHFISKGWNYTNDTQRRVEMITKNHFVVAQHNIGRTINSIKTLGDDYELHKDWLTKTEFATFRKFKKPCNNTSPPSRRL